MSASCRTAGDGSLVNVRSDPRFAAILFLLDTADQLLQSCYPGWLQRHAAIIFRGPAGDLPRKFLGRLSPTGSSVVQENTEPDPRNSRADVRTVSQASVQCE